MTDDQLQAMGEHVRRMGSQMGCDDMFGSAQWDRFAAASRDSLAEKGFDPNDRATLEHCFYAAACCLTATFYAPGLMRGPCCGALWAQAEMYRRWLQGETPIVRPEEMPALPSFDT